MPDLQLEATIIKILAGLGKSIEIIRDILTIEIKGLKTNQAKMKNAITEI